MNYLNFEKQWKNEVNSWIQEEPEEYAAFKKKIDEERDKENNHEDQPDEFYLQNFLGGIMHLTDAIFSEVNNDFERARVTYLKAVEGLRQFSEQTKSRFEYMHKDADNELYLFFTQRYPRYRENLTLLLPYIKKNPEKKQTDIYNDFKGRLKKDDISSCLYFADREGLIRRVKSGRTYLVSFLKEKEDKLVAIGKDVSTKENKNIKSMAGCFGIVAVGILIVIVVAVIIGIHSCVTG